MTDRSPFGNHVVWQVNDAFVNACEQLHVPEPDDPIKDGANCTIKIEYVNTMPTTYNVRKIKFEPLTKCL